MRALKALARCCASLAMVLAGAPSHAAPGETDWNAAARQDMQFAIDSVARSHAGAVSGQLEVTTPLALGARAGLLEAAEVKTEQDYRRALVRFIDGFGDPHTGIDVGTTPPAWTGIVIDRVAAPGVGHGQGQRQGQGQEQYRVIWSEPNWRTPLPPVDAIVQSCDGVWIGTYLKTSVAPLINHSAEYATSASEAARRVMFDTGLGWTPQHCNFTLADGASRSYALPLRAIADGIGDEHIAQVRQQYVARARPVGLYRLAGGVHWVAMPTFNGRVAGPDYERLYEALAAQQHSSWVVFDLRGNGGGDSSWGNRALQALYGKAYGARLGGAAAYAKYLIADQATITLYRRYLSLPEFASLRESFADSLRKLEAAVAKGERMAQVDGSSRDEALALAAQLRKRPGGPRIAAIIDRGCFSSCMNFVQQISAIDDTVLLGESTLGYSPYGENNRVALPSGHGTITVPSAIYTAFQATREPFVPHIAYPGKLADDAALMQWVTATLAKLKPGQGSGHARTNP